MKTKERRIHSRLSFTNEVTFEASASMAANAAEMMHIGRGTAADVSESGLCLLTHDEVLEDQILKISLPLPGVPIQTPTLAIVKWVRPHNDGYKVGMMFVV